MIQERQLAAIYQRAHDSMRNIDGLQPTEAFDELLKYLFFKQTNEELGPVVEALPEPLPATTDFLDLAAVIRGLFAEYLEKANGWATELWADRSIRLSDSALLALHRLLGSVRFRSLSFDVRSAALRGFVTPELRRGMGIFLTPDEVVRMMVEIAAPKSDALVYDPACGSGTFLVEVLKYWSRREHGPQLPVVWGTEKSARMLLLADLNLGHLTGVVLKKLLLDFLGETTRLENWLRPGSVDLILTNPPFGVSIDAATVDLATFETARDDTGAIRRRHASEVLFVEQSLRLLKPGGLLGIVLPKSVLTNSTLAPARAAIDGLASVEAVVTLPPETFSTAGTQTTTAVLFLRRYNGRRPKNARVTIPVAEVSNVGYDATGRPRSGNQLPDASRRIRNALSKGPDGTFVRLLPDVPKGQTMQRLARLLTHGPGRVGGVRLGDLLQSARTGKTPARSAYSDSGMFIVKVGNLTGHGIDWKPRERNFISLAEAERRRHGKNQLTLRRGDIVLTSSAHSPRYIAKKVDIVAEIPSFVNGDASFVGEVMRLRVQEGAADPYLLLAFLRAPKTTERLQRMIRGQTAHLMPDDVLDLEVPESVVRGSPKLRALRKLLEREAVLAAELGDVERQRDHMIHQIFENDI